MAPWLKECAAGLVAAIVTLAPVLTLGVLATAALGGNAAALGIPAAFASVALGGMVVALFGRSALPASGLSSATVVIYAAMVATLAADAAADATAIFACMAMVVFAMGLLQLAFAWLRLGSLAKFVPHPVLSGFMNAVALLIVLAQVPLLLGIEPQAWFRGAAGWRDAQPATLAVALGTALLIGAIAWRWPRAPAVLIGLCAGCAAYALVHQAFPAVALGPLAGALPAHGPRPDVALPLLDSASPAAALLTRHAPQLLATAMLLAIIGSLESILGALATDHDVGHRHDANRELVVFGGANMLVALFGGLPVVYWRSRALAVRQCGGSGPRALFVCALATGLVFLALGRVLALLPLAVLAGVMVTVGVGLVDHWTRRLVLRLWRGERHRSLLLNLGVVALVCGLTLWQGFVIGVAVGVVVSLGLFIHAMNRSLVRERYDASLRPSRRLYPAQQEQLLATRRQRIEVMVLEGALFFGSVERLASEIEGLPAHTATLVLDLRRITTIDGSGAVALLQLDDQLARRGIQLLLAGVAADNTHGRVLRAAGAPAEATAQWWPDADLAIEAAEAALIEHGEPATRRGEWPLAACSLFEGLSDAQAGALGCGMTRRPLSDGTLLFRAGDAADSLFVLTQGSISIVQLGHDDRTAQRYVSLSPGMMFGETAMLDGAGRSAAARADGESVVHELTQRDLDALSRADPALGVRVYRNIGLHLSQRLRSAAAAWRDAR